MRRGSTQAWGRYYSGAVRAASSHHDEGLAWVVALEVLDGLEEEAGRLLNGMDDLAEVVLPAVLESYGFRVVHRSEHELEYEWDTCPLGGDERALVCPACRAGMIFQEHVARQLVPQLTLFRPLAHEACRDGTSRVLLQL